MAATKAGHGGARPGAGRPPKAPYPSDGTLNAKAYTDPLVFLAAAMNDPSIELRSRIDAAKAMLAYVHLKIGKAGKKDLARTTAGKAGTGKFARSASPRLVADNGNAV